MTDHALLAEAEHLFAEYYSTIKNHYPDFADDLFREALRCYSTEAHTAVCITCRAAVEESLKEIYELLGNLGHPSARKQVEKMELEDLKKWAYHLDLIDHPQFEKIGEIQRRGNRSAHGPTADLADQWHRRLAKKKHLEEPLEIWADQSDALNQVQSTSGILHDLKQKRADIQSKGFSIIKHYPARIPEETLAEGAELSYCNALQFIDDAELILSHGRHGHAIALAMYALEEAAKSGVMQAMKVDPSLRDELSEKIALKKHVGKFMVALEAIRVNRGIELTDEVKQTIVETSQKLQSLKERGLYVEYCEKWLTPFSGDLQKVGMDVVRETRDLLMELDSLLGPSLKT